MEDSYVNEKCADVRTVSSFAFSPSLNSQLKANLYCAGEGYRTVNDAVSVTPLRENSETDSTLVIESHGPLSALAPFTWAVAYEHVDSAAPVLLWPIIFMVDVRCGSTKRVGSTNQ